MHPNPLFRIEDRALIEALIEEVGFGMVFAADARRPARRAYAAAC